MGKTAADRCPGQQACQARTKDACPGILTRPLSATSTSSSQASARPASASSALSRTQAEPPQQGPCPDRWQWPLARALRQHETACGPLPRASPCTAFPFPPGKTRLSCPQAGRALGPNAAAARTRPPAASPQRLLRTLKLRSTPAMMVPPWRELASRAQSSSALRRLLLLGVQGQIVCERTASAAQPLQDGDNILADHLGQFA